MKNKIRPDETFDTFLAEIRENETTVAELAYWFWELLEEYENCAELKELLNAKNFADLDMFLDKLASKNGITQI